MLPSFEAQVTQALNLSQTHIAPLRRQRCSLLYHERVCTHKIPPGRLRTYFVLHPSEGSLMSSTASPLQFYWASMGAY
ncbi:hypothetical protein Naga_100026g13 [Nannochloropsis gaditana]|uniref:Uncharacterized protein n=1 Tax=Nannochloropsis gaditana TaxID=72520 RepID=W7UC77_9STRA|nr:hypothetical protein Naga_100026g13 [Nannochloropsis gaditana]